MSQTLAYLNADQRVKHFELLQLLKRKEGTWLRVTEIDERELARGSRVRQFPAEWLEGMQEWCAARHCPYHMELIEGAELPAELDEMEVDDRTQWLLEHTMFCYQPLRPQNEEEALALLSYPAVDNTSEEVGLPLLPFAERQDVDTLQKLQELAVQGLVRVIDTKVTATANAAAKHSTSSLDPLLLGGGVDPSGEDDVPASKSLFQRHGGKGPLGTLAQRLSDFRTFWESSPIQLTCRHRTVQGMVLSLTDALPAVLRPGESVEIEMQDREVYHDPRDGPPPPKASWALSVQLTQDTTTSGGGSSGALPLVGGVVTDAIIVEGNARQGWRTTSSSSSSSSSAPSSSSTSLLQRRMTVQAAPWRSIQSKLQMLRFHLDLQQQTGREISWGFTVVKDPPSLTHTSRSSSYVLYRQETECTSAAIDEKSLPEALRVEVKETEGESGTSDVHGTGKEGPSSTAPAATLPAQWEGQDLGSWWSHTSPIAASVASSCLPTEGAVQQAAQRIFATTTQVHRQLSGTSHSQAQRDEQTARRKRRRYQDLRNTHMIHFGLDLSKPFVPHAPTVAPQR